MSDIAQTYLRSEDPGVTRRVRARTSSDGVTIYTATSKRFIDAGVNEEDEREITAEDYVRLLGEADPDKVAVHKTRLVVPHGEYQLEFDHVHSPVVLWLLEVELPAKDAPLRLPAEIGPYVEVTDDRAYTMAGIAAGELADRF